MDRHSRGRIWAGDYFRELHSVNPQRGHPGGEGHCNDHFLGQHQRSMSDTIAEQKVLSKRIFLTPDEAAVDALRRITEAKYELGGVIYSDPSGRYMYSDPQGDQRTGSFRAEVRIPKNAKPVALYHTHPHMVEGEQKLSEMFSADDVKTANAMKLASYIRSMASGNIRKYHPGVTPTRPEGGSRFSRGRISEGELLDLAKIAGMMRDPLDIVRGTK